MALALEGVGPRAAETVAAADAPGRVLREPICADRDLPPFDRATMDGFALRHREVAVGAPLPVIARVAAGSRFTGRVPRGACVAVATGAPVPGGLDTVVEFERSREGRDADQVTFATLPALGASIHRRGRDARAGEVLVEQGVRIRPQHAGLAATVGLSRLEVGVPPRVAIVTSGDEVVPVSKRPRAEQIRDGNGPMIQAVVDACGGTTIARMHIDDDPATAIAALRHLAARADVVVTVGGISAGERDPFVSAITGLEGEVRVRGAAIQPGGPITVWSMRRRGAAPGRRGPRRERAGRDDGRDDGRGTLVVGLPGNPVSALVCSHLFLWPLMARLLGAREGPEHAWLPVRLAADVQPNPQRTMFRPARLRTESPGLADVSPWSGSGDLSSAAATHGIVEVPPATVRVPAGQVLRFLPWAWLTP